MTDCGVRGLSTQHVVELLESRTAESEVSGSNPRARFLLLEQTSSLSRVVMDGGDPCSVPLSG